MAEGPVQIGEAVVEYGLVFLEDRIQADVLRDALERDVRHGAVLESTRRVCLAVGGVVALDCVVREGRRHEPLPRDCKRDA